MSEQTTTGLDKMINAMALSVPIEVDSGFGKSWFEAH